MTVGTVISQSNCALRKDIPKFAFQRGVHTLTQGFWDSGIRMDIKIIFLFINSGPSVTDYNYSDSRSRNFNIIFKI